MDPLTITASVVNITTAALQTVQFLAETIDNIKGMPETIRGISADLRAVEPVLQNLNSALQNDSSQIILSDQIKPAVENCNRACMAFRSQIDHWMRHSTEDKTFWMDRWKIGMFGQERINTFKGQLRDCKGTLSVALSTATMYLSSLHTNRTSILLTYCHGITTSRQDNLMKEMKDMMLQQNEAVLRQQIAKADSETTVIERSLQQLTVAESSELGETSGHGKESEQSKQELLQELGRQQADNTAFREMCQGALLKTVYERTGQKIKGIKATNNSSALTGFINTSGEESKFDQDISDVTVDNWSVAVTGVIKNVDFKDLRPGLHGGGNVCREP
ncbi:MAG: hypothetical protein M1825_005211 [Sarcosagium campestre]|nr:MAG: hypothetical protein M1825_005211 [Sarcosagium campestre]